MMTNCGVFRDAEKLKLCINDLKGLQKRYKAGKITDKGKLFNTEVYEIIELGNMLQMAEIIATSALAREESRGGHARTDFPDRDDEKFLQHTLVYLKDGGLEIKYKPVTITRHQPKERKY